MYRPTAEFVPNTVRRARFSLVSSPCPSYVIRTWPRVHTRPNVVFPSRKRSGGLDHDRGDEKSGPRHQSPLSPSSPFLLLSLSLSLSEELFFFPTVSTAVGRGCYCARTIVCVASLRVTHDKPGNVTLLPASGFGPSSSRGRA